MEAPATLADALEALSASNVRMTELSGEVVALNQLLTEASTAISERDSLRAQIELMDKANADLAAQLAAVAANEQDANSKAVEIVASIGVEPATVATVEQKSAPLTRSQLEAACAATNDPKERARLRNEFLSR
jgi:hypothetical protein